MRPPAALGFLADRLARDMLDAPGVPRFDFAHPPGEPALVAPCSVSWRVFRNPVALFVGGVAAVVLELAEPAVRSGVWEHSSFRTDPVGRLRRTGLAAMVTVYGARSGAEAMIAGVRRAHDRVAGVTPAGEAYGANDPDLLRWVQATAVWGFGEAYSRYVRPLGPGGFDRLFAEGAPAARLYGVSDPPLSLADWRAALGGMRPRLEPSPIVHEFLRLMRDAPALPRALRPVQRLMVRGAVGITPGWVRERLGLERGGPRPGEAALLRRLGRLADALELPSSPPAQALKRLGLPADHLRR